MRCSERAEQAEVAWALGYTLTEFEALERRETWDRLGPQHGVLPLQARLEQAQVWEAEQAGVPLGEYRARLRAQAVAREHFAPGVTDEVKRLVAEGRTPFSLDLHVVGD